MKRHEGLGLSKKESHLFLYKYNLNIFNILSIFQSDFEKSHCEVMGDKEISAKVDPKDVKKFNIFSFNNKPFVIVKILFLEKAALTGYSTVIELFLSHLLMYRRRRN